MAEFLKFREHRQSCLPQILQGEAPELPVTKKTGAKSAKDSSPSGEKDQGKTREAGTSELGAEVPQKQEGNPEKGAPNEPATEVTLKQTSKQIDSLIAIVTPLQFTKGNPDEGWIFNEELMPISIEELPPNEFFFDKKRKAMVRQGFYQKEGAIAKKFKIMTDGKAAKEEKFVEEIMGR
jgi:hypothetical protein